jgi:tetratricopeptide (TPR) repeat protein
MSQTVASTDFNTEMKQTELGDFIVKNKAFVFVIVFIIIAGIGSYGATRFMAKQKNDEAAAVVHTFKVNELAAFQTGKMSATDVVSKYSSKMAEYKSTSPYLTGALALFDALAEKSNFNEAYGIIVELKADNVYQQFFLDMRKAFAQEELGKTDEAIKTLNTLATSELKVLEGKIYLDLGRLYMLKNNKEMAKKSFEYVQKVNTQKIFKTMATQYLLGL